MIEHDCYLLSFAAEKIGCTIDELLEVIMSLQDIQDILVYFVTEPEWYLWECEKQITLPPVQGAWFVELDQYDLEEIIEKGFVKQDYFGGFNMNPCYISTNPKFKHTGVVVKKEQLAISKADFIEMTEPSSHEEIIKHRKLEENITQNSIRVAEVSQTERNTMLKLIIGMAMDAYGYNPKATKNKATGENNGSIKAALDRVGISLDADTIRNYLKEAKDLLLPPAQ